MERIKQLDINEEGFAFDPGTGESFMVNATGIFVLKCLGKNLTAEAISDTMIREYGVAVERVELDMMEFLEQLLFYKLL